MILEYTQIGSLSKKVLFTTTTTTTTRTPETTTPATTTPATMTPATTTLATTTKTTKILDDDKSDSINNDDPINNNLDNGNNNNNNNNNNTIDILSTLSHGTACQLLVYLYFRPCPNLDLLLWVLTPPTVDPWVALYPKHLVHDPVMINSVSNQL